MNNIINYMSGKGKCLLTAVLIGSSLTAWADGGRELKGRVTDPDGNPIAGAIVNVAEQSRIVITDTDGNFTLKDVGFEDEINTKCIGYDTKIVAVEDFDKPLVIILDPDTDAYKKIRNLAFQDKPARYTTEATSIVTGEELQRYPVTVLQNAFNSLLTGVQTYEASTEPGWAETKMYIRGIRTMNAAARNPIVIVDNVERDISFLDAFPIDNVTILKDAAATALYGMRGANGVILVTTKRGEAGKTNIEFTQEIGWQTLTNTMENQNAYNHAMTSNQVRYLDGKDPLYTPEQLEKYRRVSNGETLEGIDRYRYFSTNWGDVLYRDHAPVYKTNLQISGGNNRARYYVSASYLRQEGMWNNDATQHKAEDYSSQHVLDRFNLRTNLDINVNKYLRVGLDLGGRIDNIVQPTASVFNLTTFGMVETNVFAPVYCPNGELYVDNNTNNPLYQLGSSGLEKNRRRQLYSTVTVNGDLSVITKGLGVDLVASFDAYDGFESTQTNDINTYSYDYMNMAVQRVEDFTYTRTHTYSELTNPNANERDNSWTLNLRGGVSYDRTFGKHHVDARAFVRSYMKRNNRGPHSANWFHLSSDRYLAYNGVLNYIFDGRYIVNGSISYMGNDNFDPDNRWDTFWGVGAGWVMSNEPWLRKDWMDLLKIRASYGKTGMSDTGSGRYPYQSIFDTSTGYSFGKNETFYDGYAEKTSGNPNSRWEISKMVNLGLDWGFFNNRLYGNLDLWKEWRSNILIERSTNPDLLGISFAKDSYGKVESKGMELTIGHYNKIGNVEYSIEGLLSYNTNKITEMDELEPAVPWQRKTGQRIRGYESVASLYESENRDAIGGWNMYQFVQWASDPSLVATSQQDAIDHPEKYPYNTFSGGGQKLGTAVFKDLNGDRQIDSRDMAPIGYTMLPDWTPSVSLSVKYKGFDFRAVGTAYLNRSVFLSPSMTFSEWGSNNSTHEVVNAWGYYTDDPMDPRNINAKYPRLSFTYNSEDSSRDNGSYQNTIWIRNGDYFSLRNIEFGYSLPEKLIAKAYMTKCRVYFSAYNVATWSHLPKDMDPERPMGYCWWYPKTRIFSFGINVAF
ncbi:MAG TPA: TonB-dependent receptor [Muribaculum sp.]|uniref:TonB-dependent receptor n=1 Tax=Heminiphilus faecis TaxID=2601703 RepID=A0ABV4CZU0_9BACT|nr:TonB-dependent receptor [Heminiphilus faecis]RLT77874.1 TonB-dependent receptor [bacterium J10(2018)]DAT44824.1 MAG TPA: TonB-linked outer membrane protein, SusC/RagA family [Caudoviricetes sp.]HRF68044.1 TonB-dependent receptor [Muribaculum sp.]